MIHYRDPSFNRLLQNHHVSEYSPLEMDRFGGSPKPVTA